MTLFSLHQIETAARTYAGQMPLDLFVAAGSFVEEIIPIIPATAIMIPAGSLALTQGHGWAFLLWLALASTVPKTFASWLLYVLGDRLEDVLIAKIGWLFGVKHEDVEKIGARLSGGWKDDAVLFLIRLVPFVPTPPVSIVCGVIKVRIVTYLWTSFVAFFIKNVVYLYIGYGGVKAYARLARYFERYQIHVNWIILLAVAVVVAVAYWVARRKSLGK